MNFSRRIRRKEKGPITILGNLPLGSFFKFVLDQKGEVWVRGIKREREWYEIIPKKDLDNLAFGKVTVRSGNTEVVEIKVEEEVYETIREI